MASEDDRDWSERLEDAAATLEAIVADRGLLADLEADLRMRLLKAAGRVARPTNTERRRQNRVQRARDRARERESDRRLAAQTRIRKLRDNPIFQTPRRRGIEPPGPSPSPGEYASERVCYVCRGRYREIHFFYDQLCPTCGDFNHDKRSQTADLTGRVALITGSRVKIGYHAAILMLRAGCRVICTTRFPRDAARRYAAEEDFGVWGDRLEIVGIDLRRVGQVEALCEALLGRLDRLDFIINNACQTVRRPPGFYGHLMERELLGLSCEAEGLVRSDLSRSGARSSAEWSQLPLLPGDADAQAFPVGLLDADQQQIDLREINSWRLRMAEVPTLELLEVHLVNAVAPFILNARLKPLMLAVPTADKHIVNVSAMEGQFYRTFKSDRHPHTNMAKASLNMMTRTSAADYVKDGIHMNSVDTGWITDEDPAQHAERKREEHGFHPPLDIVDGAARIVDPILDGINTGDHVWGQFLKDYKPTDW
ncbi:MAG TPA: SDR family oxidoreductase [Deltaproteobacteria bacterium]|nr:SDR family oxidoreductase [Deltaproteobacteria bacterium]